MWAEDAVFWSITQATEVNGFKPSPVERHHKFSKVGEEDFETGDPGLQGGKTLGRNGSLKRSISSIKSYHSLHRLPGMGRILPTQVLLCDKD